jgi:hypothetical protein
MKSLYAFLIFLVHATFHVHLLPDFIILIILSAKESLGNYELKKHKPWFDEECSELLDQRKTSQIAVVTGSKRKKMEII